MTREEAINIITKERDEDIFGNWTPHRKRIHEAFTLAIEALKADRPRGEWIKATESTCKCSLCNGIMYVESNYCPFCGAKMDERSE